MSELDDLCDTPGLVLDIYSKAILPTKMRKLTNKTEGNGRKHQWERC